MITIVVCDQRPLVAGALCETLLTQPDLTVAGTARSGSEALELVRSQRPEVVVTGVYLDGLTGIELARRIRAEAEDAPAVVLYAPEDPGDTLGAALQAGVAGLLTGEVSVEELFLAVRTVAQGNTLLNPAAARRLLDGFRDRAAGSTAAPGTLSERERQVLALAARDLPDAEIARALGIGPGTVRTHVHRAREKLNLPDRAAVVAYARRAGLAGL